MPRTSGRSSEKTNRLLSELPSPQTQCSGLGWSKPSLIPLVPQFPFWKAGFCSLQFPVCIKTAARKQVGLLVSVLQMVFTGKDASCIKQDGPGAIVYSLG